MSGGSYDYAYFKVQETASEMRRRHPDSSLHLGFAAHLDKVAEAMRAVEWVDSFDSAPGDDVAAIRAVVSPADELVGITARAEVVRAGLDSAIKRANALAEEQERQVG